MINNQWLSSRLSLYSSRVESVFNTGTKNHLPPIITMWICLRHDFDYRLECTSKRYMNTIVEKMRQIVLRNKKRQYYPIKPGKYNPLYDIFTRFPLRNSLHKWDLARTASKIHNKLRQNLHFSISHEIRCALVHKLSFSKSMSSLSVSSVSAPLTLLLIFPLTKSMWETRNTNDWAWFHRRSSVYF